MTIRKQFKEAMMAYGMHSSYVRQILHKWTMQKKIIPNNCKELMTGGTENSAAVTPC